MASKTPPENNSLKAVSVIASFDTSGQIKPLYIRIGKESLKVYRSFLMAHNIFGNIFRCEVMDGDQVKEVKLSYHADKFLWILRN